MRLRCLPIAAGIACSAGVAGAQVVVTGVVTDSLTQRPLAGAVVQLQRDSSLRLASATTDSAGAFRIEGLAPGWYIAGFFHAKLDSIGISLSAKRVELAAGAPRRLDFAVPSAKTVIAAVCPNGMGTDSVGVLLGHIRDAETQIPHAGTVTVLWQELVISSGGVQRNRQQIPVKTDVEGWFAFCGIPSDVDVNAFATSEAQESGVIEVRVPPGGLLVRDFLVSRSDSTIAVLADSAAPDSARRQVATLRRGQARVSGSVMTSKRKAVTNAEVSVPGTGLSVRSADGGAFALAGLPSGTQSVEVRALGFEPKRVTVDLTREHPTRVDVVLDRPVQTLDVVKVFGRGHASLVEFERRRRAGWGRFLTPADIQRHPAIRVTDLFRTMPGVRVVPTGSFGNQLLLRGCAPTIYLNGMRMPDDAAGELDMLASANEITAIEVYSAAGRPAEFWGNNCGSVVVWAGMLPR